jgi:hypothetical protein
MGYEVVAPGPAFKPLSEDFVYGDRTTQQGWRNGTQMRDIQSVVVPPLSEQASQSVANRKTPKPLTQDFLYGDRTPETGWSAGIKVQDIQAVNAPAASASERWLTEGFAAKPAATSAATEEPVRAVERLRRAGVIKTRTGAPTMQAPATEDVLPEVAAAPTQAGVRGSVTPTNEAPTSRQSPTHEQLSSADAAMGYEVVAPGPAFKPLSQDFVYGDRTTQQNWKNGIQQQDIQSVVVPPLSEQAAKSPATGTAPKPLTHDFLYGDGTPGGTGWRAGIKVKDIQSVNSPAAGASGERWLTEGFAADPNAH